MAALYRVEERLLSSVLVYAALLLGSSPASAQTVLAEPFLRVGAAADAPAGFLAMCVREPILCDQAAAPVYPADSHQTASNSVLASAPSQPTSSIGSTAAIAPASLAAARASKAATFAVEAGMSAPAPTNAAWLSPQSIIPVIAARPLATADNARLWSEALEKDAPLSLIAREQSVPSEPAAPVFADISAADLRRFNRSINRHVIQREDIDTYGVAELWRPSGTGRGAFGDCEDIALEKQLEFKRLGMPAEAARLAVVYHRTLGLHVVLVVRTARGDFVLDSVTGAVRRWSETPYQWLRVQDASNRMVWQRVV